MLLQDGAGALCSARLGEGSVDGSSLACWGCAELVMQSALCGFFCIDVVCSLLLDCGVLMSKSFMMYCYVVVVETDKIVAFLNNAEF